MKLIKEFTKGIVIDNPTFALVLGLCPTLAVSTTVVNALGMGVAATFVLLGSNTIISSIRHLIPSRIRLPIFIVIIIEKPALFISFRNRQYDIFFCIWVSFF